jgi:hypothetical protein
VVLLAFLANAAAGWHFIVTGAPDALLYAASFDENTDDWQQFDDGQLSAQVADGALILQNDVAGRYAFSVARPRYADFDLRVEATAVSGPLNNGYGVLFRYRDASNYYAFLVSSDGFYRLSRVVAGSERILSEWVDTPVVTQGFERVQRLRVVALGDQFRFFVNDTPVQLCIPNDASAVSTYRSGLGCIGGTMQDVLTDGSIVDGQVGVVAVTLSEPNVVVRFDNVLVWSPAVNDR